MKVLLLRTWLTNIGNGFIDMGAREIIRQSFPNADIIESSGFSNFVSFRKSAGTKEDILYRKLGIRGEPPQKRHNLINIADLADVDIAVLPGCILYNHVWERYEQTIASLYEKDTPIILLGAGGGNYSTTTQEYMSEMIDKYELNAILTRDKTAFDCYSDMVDYSYNGIDCAFFISDWYNPPNQTEDMISMTFDKTNEPKIETNKTVVRPDHNPFYSRDNGTVDYLLKLLANQETLFQPPEDSSLEEKNAFISDSIKDYLYIYKNSSTTYSDRIHACVPSLVYGNKAQFCYDTPRGGLFEKVLPNRDISSKALKLDPELLAELKDGQVKAFKQISKSVLNK